MEEKKAQIITVTKLTLQIGKKELELTPDEARSLLLALRDLLGSGNLIGQQRAV